MMKQRCIPGALVATFLLLTASSAQATEGQGFFELRFSTYPGAEGELWQTIERFRPSFETEISERMAVVGVVEAALVQGRNTSSELQRTLEASSLGPLLTLGDCSWPSYANNSLRIDSVDDYLDVDRLYLDIYGKLADIRIGRQAINWGSAQSFNPTDPFPEVLFAEPWRPRHGVNAVRVTAPLGSRNDLQLVAASNDVFTEARAAARLRVNWRETDWALATAWRGDDNSGLVGVDLRGTLGVGWWVEAAANFGEHIDTPYEVATVGIDYSFPVLERMMVFAQYHRNGAGKTDPDDYQRSMTSAVAGPECNNVPGGLLPGGDVGEPDPFAPFTSARDYLMLGATLAVDQDLSGSLFALQNLNDGTAIVVPNLRYLINDWLDLSATAQVPLALWGDGGEFKPRDQDLVLPNPLGAPFGSDVDLSGLVPAATITLWTRVTY